MRKLMLILMLVAMQAHAGSTSDVWVATDRTMADLVRDGFWLVGFDVDSGHDFASGIKMRFVLQRDSGGAADRQIAMCTEQGRKHLCWLVRKK